MSIIYWPHRSICLYLSASPSSLFTHPHLFQISRPILPLPLFFLPFLIPTPTIPLLLGPCRCLVLGAATVSGLAYRARNSGVGWYSGAIAG